MTHEVELIQHGGKWYDLVFSEDDCGWYLQRHEDDAVSQMFPTRVEARGTLVTDYKSIQWEK